MSANPVIPQAGVALIYETVDKAILEGLKRFAHTALERDFTRFQAQEKTAPHQRVREWRQAPDAWRD